jgi:Peptidase family M23
MAEPSPSPGFDNTPINSQSGGTLVSPSPGNPAATSGTNVEAGTPTTPPAEFIALAHSRITGMIGAQDYLIQGAQLDALILKLWQQPAIQQDWNSYRSDPSRWGASLVQDVQNQILGGSSDDSLTVDYTNLKLGAGKGLTLAEQSALANVTQAQGANVPSPFNAKESGFAYGTPLPAGADWGGWDKHYGQDYGTTAGSRIVSPFAGTVEIKHDAWRGNQVVVHLDNGWSIGFGHVAQGFADGQRVNPGDLIAISGQNVGISKGAVTLVELLDPKGHPQDPRQMLDPIFAGTTFNNLKMPDGSPIPSALAGTGMPSVNKILDTEYPSIKNDWTTYFGSPPSPEDVENVLQHGTSPDQWKDFIRAMPSHIPGLPMGDAYDLRNVATSISQKMYGHDTTDGIVAELFNQKLTAPSDVQYFYDMMPGKDFGPGVYAAAASANTQITSSIFLDSGADPRSVSAQVQSHIDSGAKGGGGYT